MGQTIPEQDSNETLPTIPTNPTPRQDGVQVPLHNGEGNSSPEPHTPEASPNSHPPDLIPANAEREFRKREPRKVCRTDSGKIHRVRHGILSREVLDSLVRAGEDRKTLRRLERQYRKTLQPTGPFGNLIFDRFWSSYMRLILIGRLEARLFDGKSDGESKSCSLALVPGHQPTLVRKDSEDQPSDVIPLMEALPPDLLRGLVLAQRYDCHYSREMYRSLALLVILRRGGEAALEDWAREMLGGSRTRQENQDD